MAEHGHPGKNLNTWPIPKAEGSDGNGARNILKIKENS
jgi:hypothetical protein